MGFVEGWALRADVNRGPENSRRKAFRALTDSVVEKMFLSPSKPTPPGWFEDPQEALAAWPEREKEIAAEAAEAAKAEKAGKKA